LIHRPRLSNSKRPFAFPARSQYKYGVCLMIGRAGGEFPRAKVFSGKET
jgi:hypothetical protein